MEPRWPGATELFHCPFDAAWDKNFDHWPDEWQRRAGPGFPRYVGVEIRRQPTPVGSECLRIDLNGGAVAVQSPPIPIRLTYAYVVEGLLEVQGLENDRACLSLTLLDGNQRPLETVYSEKIRDSQGWTTLRVGPVAPRRADAKLAIIGLHLESGAPPDLAGSVALADVWLGRLPRILLWASNQHHVFTDAGEIAVTCSASGLSVEEPPVVFRLEDQFGALVDEEQRRLKTHPASDGPLRSSGRLADEASAPDVPTEETGTLVGSIVWSLPVPGPGFYRASATVLDREQTPHRRQLDLAVIRPDAVPRSSDFGWSLPRGGKPLTLEELSDLVGRAAIGWVKYPLWLDESASDEEVHELARFAQNLRSQGIELVGLLDDPPDALRSEFPLLSSPAQLFIDESKPWYPSLESVTSRLGIPVRWWQLGRDTDTGFVGYPKLAEKIADVRAQFEQLGQDVHLGFGWDWRRPLPSSASGTPPWRFLTLSADPPLTEQELAAHLAASQHLPWRRWVVLEPLSRDRHDPPTRAADLIRQVILAKADGADSLFISAPFDADHGLMNEDGSVGELFLPWRTTATLLGGARYLGSIQLPQGSRNHVFARGTEAVMIVWNDAPEEEVIYLGDDVRQIDPWGRTTTPKQREHRQVIEVGTLPTFVTGVSEKIVRWRQSFSLASDRVPSVVGGPHQNSFRLINPFDEKVAGRVELVAPDAWQPDPRRVEFQLAPNERLEQPFRIVLPYNATSGRHPIRVDFELERGEATAGKSHAASGESTGPAEVQPVTRGASSPGRRFSVYRHLDVGPNDIYIEIATRLNGQGELEVEQHLVNDTAGPISFRCHLFAPQRRRQNTLIIGLDRGRQLNTYRLRNGRELVGKALWLRAEQIDGPRVLNYRFVAEE
jgi:hypothetical protein